MPASPWRQKNEIADYYRCNVRTITNLMQRRILPFVKIGRLVRFIVTECDLAMENTSGPARCSNDMQAQRLVKEIDLGDALGRMQLPRRAHGGANGNLCASATARFVTRPSFTLMPLTSAGIFRQAAASPQSASVSR